MRRSVQEGEPITQIFCIYQLWDAYAHGRCWRASARRMKHVKDATFPSGGQRLLSWGCGRQMRLWDTEEERCVQRCSNGKPSCAAFFPADENKQQLSAADTSGKKTTAVRSPHLRGGAARTGS